MDALHKRGSEYIYLSSDFWKRIRTFIYLEELYKNQ